MQAIGYSSAFKTNEPYPPTVIILSQNVIDLIIFPFENEKDWNLYRISGCSID